MSAIGDENAAADDHMVHVTGRGREDDRRYSVIGIRPSKPR